MVYQEGSFEDFDGYANLTGDNGWKWDNMIKYAKKVRIALDPLSNKSYLLLHRTRGWSHQPIDIILQVNTSPHYMDITGPFKLASQIGLHLWIHA
jgi:hypothetical protein